MIHLTDSKSLLLINRQLVDLQLAEFKNLIKNLIKNEQRNLVQSDFTQTVSVSAFKKPKNLQPKEFEYLSNFAEKVKLFKANLANQDFKAVINFLNENCKIEVWISFLTEYFWQVFLMKGWSVFSDNNVNNLPIKLILLKLHTLQIIKKLDPNQKIMQSLQSYVHFNFDQFVEYVSTFKLSEMSAGENELHYQLKNEPFYNGIWESYYKELDGSIEQKKLIIREFRAFTKLVFQGKLDSFFKTFGEEEDYNFFIKVHAFLNDIRTCKQHLMQTELEELSKKNYVLFFNQLDFRIFNFSPTQTLLLENLIFPFYAVLNYIFVPRKLKMSNRTNNEGDSNKIQMYFLISSLRYFGKL